MVPTNSMPIRGKEWRTYLMRFACSRQRVHKPNGQFSKIEELVQALKSAGFVTLEEQAKALGLSRSTASTIRKVSHKASGLSASIINRMLAAPQLPAPARPKLLESRRLLWRQSESTPSVRRASFNLRIAVMSGN